MWEEINKVLACKVMGQDLKVLTAEMSALIPMYQDAILDCQSCFSFVG
jgi:hypothetical protein